MVIKYHSSIDTISFEEHSGLGLKWIDNDDTWVACRDAWDYQPDPHDDGMYFFVEEEYDDGL